MEVLTLQLGDEVVTCVPMQVCLYTLPNMLSAIISFLSSPSSASFFPGVGIADHVCTWIDIYLFIDTHTDKHLYTSGAKPFLPGEDNFCLTFDSSQAGLQVNVWRRPGQNCFKCHLPSAKQISLFPAATWRKQNTKSVLKVMSVALLTFLSMGGQRLALSFSALHLYYSCNAQGLKAYWEMFPVSPENGWHAMDTQISEETTAGNRYQPPFLGYLQ